jgi:K+-sensing histidine kinase KdpD
MSQVAATTTGEYLLQAVIGLAIGSALAWVFVPIDVTGLPVALFIPIVSVMASRGGGRLMGAGTAVAGSLWFGYLHTEPRFSPVIHARADVILTLATLVVSLLASELADARKRLRQADSRIG